MGVAESESVTSSLLKRVVVEVGAIVLVGLKKSFSKPIVFISSKGTDQVVMQKQVK